MIESIDHECDNIIKYINPIILSTAIAKKISDSYVIKKQDKEIKQLNVQNFMFQPTIKYTNIEFA